MAKKLTIDVTKLHLISIEMLRQGVPWWEYQVTFDISEVVATPPQKVRLSVNVGWPHHGLRENHLPIADIESLARREVRRMLEKLIETVDLGNQVG